MKLTIIGSGNVATRIGLALRAAKIKIGLTSSRNAEHAMRLSVVLGAESFSDLDAIGEKGSDSDVWLFAVKDDAIASLADEMARKAVFGDKKPVMIHTSGSTPMDVFAGCCDHYGVLYPLQTLSKEREVDFRKVPCFIEGSDETALKVVRSLAESITDRVVEMDSGQRRKMHLAAVWACNFVNHCYDVADGIMQSCGLDFDLLLPLIDETARKVHEMSPRNAQTGPAIRYDRRIIDAHLQLLSETPQLADIYEKMSKDINKTAPSQPPPVGGELQKVNDSR